MIKTCLTIYRAALTLSRSSPRQYLPTRGRIVVMPTWLANAFAPEGGCAAGQSGNCEQLPMTELALGGVGESPWRLYHWRPHRHGPEGSASKRPRAP